MGAGVPRTHIVAAAAALPPISLSLSLHEHKCGGGVGGQVVDAVRVDRVCCLAAEVGRESGRRTFGRLLQIPPCTGGGGEIVSMCIGVTAACLTD